MNRYRYPYYPRRRTGMWLLVIVIIVIVVVIYANSKGFINLGSINLGNFSLSSGNQTGSAQPCVQKVNTCGSIIHLKFGANVTVLSSLQAQNSNDASQFLNTWKGSAQLPSMSSYNVSSYPISLVATRFDYLNGTKSPRVFICKSDGNLEETTVLGLC